MAKIHLPGLARGIEVETEGPSRDTQYLLAALGRVAQLLEGLINQNDLMIRLEVGADTRIKVKKRIVEFQQAREAAEAAATAAEDGVGEGEGDQT